MSDRRINYCYFQCQIVDAVGHIQPAAVTCVCVWYYCAFWRRVTAEDKLRKIKTTSLWNHGNSWRGNIYIFFESKKGSILHNGVSNFWKTFTTESIAVYFIRACWCWTINLMFVETWVECFSPFLRPLWLKREMRKWKRVTIVTIPPSAQCLYARCSEMLSIDINNVKADNSKSIGWFVKGGVWCI